MTSNRLAAASLLSITAAVGALAGPWWALLILGVALAGMAWVAYRWETADALEPVETDTAPPSQIRAA